MNKERRLAALFDLDGVVLDTEGQYDQFWSEQGKHYHPEIPEFNRKIKGQTIGKILEDYFTGNTELQQQILRELDEFESKMDYPYVPGAEEFIRALLKNNLRTALVTSSNDKKMAYVMKAHPEFVELFECMVTANKITRSKPDPEGYLLAARELGMEVDACCVFEDSFSGVAAGRNAGMKVVGLTTTNPKEKMEGMVDRLIPDFIGYQHEDFLRDSL